MHRPSLSPRWKKVFRELWVNRTRTLLVVASIAVGIFAVGTVQQLRSVLLSEMQAVYDGSSAAHASIFAQGVDDEMLEVIRRMPDVVDAEGRGTAVVNVAIGPDEWESLTVTAVDDFEANRINLIEPVMELDDGTEVGAEYFAWPARDQIVLERSSLSADDALPEGLRVGDSLTLETQEGKVRDVTLTGLVYDPNGFPTLFTGTGSGYVDFETLERLGGSANFNEVLIRVNGSAEQLLDQAYINTIANDVADKIEKSGREVQRVSVPTPGKLPLQDLFDSISLLLTPLGILALALSSFLVVNTINALMAQQVRQIGVMKSIGGSRKQIALMYLSAVLIYSLLALLIAVPLTVAVVGLIAQFLGAFINVSFPAISLPTDVLAVQIGVGILVPLLAALYPIFKGTSVTVREAISDFGIGAGQMGTDLIGRLLAKVRGLSRPMQISLRNTFRRRGRLALTLITLILGGMLFMTVGSVRISLDNLIEEALQYNQFDIQIEFERPYRAAQIEQIVNAVPGVVAVETWGGGQATRIRDDGSEGDPITISALPAESGMVQPTLMEGRWLLPEDESAIVISQKVLANEPDIAVGDLLTLGIDGKEGAWTVVGIAQVLGGPPNVVPAYTNYPYFARYSGSVGQAASVQIQTEETGSVYIAEKVTEIEETMDRAGLRVASTFTIEQLRAFTGGFFDIIVYLLLIMGVLIAAVGALGLMGTMSTNVLERTREIGVMRAIGASDGSVLRIVIVEGIIIGMISWAVGAALAYPTGLGLSSAVGTVLFQTALPYTFSANGVFTWLGIVALLATIASFLPAWSASRLTVREVLAYE